MKSSKSSGSFRFYGFLSCASLALGAVSGGALAAEPTPSAPAVPPAIAVPGGAKLTAKLHAIGAQIYACAAPAAAGGKPAWTLKRPDATLSDASGAAAGTHGAGPSWTAKDGSSITAKKLAEAAAPSPTAVAWLLLGAVSHTGKGLFSNVTYVQRANTSGGKAPATGCDTATVGTEQRVDYSADYYFFHGAARP